MDSNYIDVDFYGETEVNGQIKEHTGAFAIENAFLAWLMSEKGEYIDDPEQGGVLDSLVFKNLTQDYADIIRFQILNAVDINFTPQLYIQDISVTPDFVNRMWDIRINYFIPQTNTYSSVTIFPDAKDVISVDDKVQVDYIGDNLLNFVLLKMDEIKTKMYFNSETNYYEWGNYQFINLSEDDLRFSEIQNLIGAS